jgi:hypothetical protein
MSVLPVLVRGEQTYQTVIHLSRHRPASISSQFRVFGVFRRDIICIRPV